MQIPSYTETGAGQTPLFVIGHLNPDTDAICSAIGYAELLRRKEYPDAQAACCGGLNPRTRWTLEKAGLEPPKLIMDVRPTAETVCRTDVIKAREDETFLDVIHRMEKAGVRSIPVVDEHDHVVGLASAQDLLNLLLHTLDTKGHARRVRTSLESMAHCLEGKFFSHGPRLDQEEELILTVSASSAETVGQRLTQFSPEKLVLVVGDRPEVHALAVAAKVRAIVLTRGAQLSADLQAAAQAHGTSVIGCEHDTASTVQLIRCSRRIADAVDKGCMRFSHKTLVAGILPQITHSAQALFPVIREESGKLLGVFSKSDLLSPPRQRLVLVDHNEFSQAVPGAAESHILEVLDHHRLSGNLVSREPIRFINEPVGSTSTIVARLFTMQHQTPSKPVALCLAAGIISDTLKLTGPTTTNMDREMLWWLAGVAGINVESFAEEFFAAGSLLRTGSVDAVLGTDRKEFTENDWRISISQIEEVGLAALSNRLAELQSGLEALRLNKAQDYACLIVTDIRNHDSVLLVAGSELITDAIDYPNRGDGTFDMPGVVSRKKQFFPYMANILGQVLKES
jgi:manganese-dependent inorganic pyrophosphatase